MKTDWQPFATHTQTQCATLHDSLVLYLSLYTRIAGVLFDGDTCFFVDLELSSGFAYYNYSAVGVIISLGVFLAFIGYVVNLTRFTYTEGLLSTRVYL